MRVAEPSFSNELGAEIEVSSLMRLHMPLPGAVGVRSPRPSYIYIERERIWQPAQELTLTSIEEIDDDSDRCEGPCSMRRHELIVEVP